MGQTQSSGKRRRFPVLPFPPFLPFLPILLLSASLAEARVVRLRIERRERLLGVGPRA